MSLSTNCDGGTVTWFDAAENRTQLGMGTGSPLVHSSTANTNYFVTCQNGNYTVFILMED